MNGQALKITFSCLLLISCALSSAQNNKREILLDEYDKQISPEKFKEKIASPDYNYTYSVFENDTAKFAKTLLRRQYGKMSLEYRNQIVKGIVNLTHTEIKDDQTVVVNYFYNEMTNNKQKMIEHYTTDLTYIKFFERNPQYLQYNIIEKHVNFTGNSIFKDSDNIIKSLLFPYPLAVSYIIIWPDGKYYKQLNEYRLDEIPRIVKEGK